MAAQPAAPARVVAVVVTFNRRALLLECLEALAEQTQPLAGVLLVDNASTDGTIEAVEESGIADRLTLEVVRVARNGGGAEGFHYGVRAALERESDWLWLMDDDCAPDPDCLERLLASPHAAAPETTLLAPVVLSAERRLLGLNRGRVRRRWGLAPLVALPDEEQEGTEAEIGFCTFVGPLIRTPAARTAGLPMREMFIRNDDVEYCLRLGGPERMWLVPAARIVHKDLQPFVDAAGLGARLREFLRPAPVEREWKNLYALRNLVFLSRRHRLLSGGQLATYAAVQVVRRLLLSDRRLRAFRLAALYATDGARGRFRNVVPARWPEVARAKDPGAVLRAHGLRYGDDVAGAPHALGARTGGPAT